mgnify:CR=1 FL=1
MSQLLDQTAQLLISAEQIGNIDVIAMRHSLFPTAQADLDEMPLLRRRSFQAYGPSNFLPQSKSPPLCEMVRSPCCRISDSQTFFNWDSISSRNCVTFGATSPR